MQALPVGPGTDERRFGCGDFSSRAMHVALRSNLAKDFRHALHPELRADFVVNPLFNDSDWFRNDDDVRGLSLSASTGKRDGAMCQRLHFDGGGVQIAAALAHHPGANGKRLRLVNLTDYTAAKSRTTCWRMRQRQETQIHATRCAEKPVHFPRWQNERY